MGLFTTRQLLGYTEQKVKFRALFSGAVFPPYGEFPYRRGDAGQNYRKKTPVAAYVSPVVEGKVLRHRRW